MPRAIWFIMFMFICHFMVLQLTDTFLKFNNNIVLLTIDIFLTTSGAFYWMYIAYYMRKAFFDKNLLTKGPFKNVRHPMYIAIYTMLFGLGVLFFSWAWFAVMTTFMPIWYVVYKIEEKQMVELHGKEYISYREYTGIFIPRIQI